MPEDAAQAKPIPFDAAKLDTLLEDADIDVLIATSKHNVQYLLGGYRFFFFESMDAAGISRYLPALVYQRGRPDTALYVGNSMEAYERDLGKFWTPNLRLSSWTSFDTMQQVAEHISRLGGVRRIGVETAFLPADADALLRQNLANRDLVDAHFPLERLRARKTPREIDLLRAASERVVESMLAVFRTCEPGQTKQQITDRLRIEEVNRGLTFDYCLITAGTSLNRAPSEQRLAAGDILSLDSGGNNKGYIGDLCRMGMLGRPDQELQELLGFIDEVQMAARKAATPGAIGGNILEVAERKLATSPLKMHLHFAAHGMGLVTHEAPRLMHFGSVPYEGYDRDRPLEPGMVLSIETTLAHPRRGFIKLEDTILVTDSGYEALGDGARGWNATVQ
jgi:Xaa-Pro aminopeptidase